RIVRTFDHVDQAEEVDFPADHFQRLRDLDGGVGAAAVAGDDDPQVRTFYSRLEKLESGLDTFDRAIAPEVRPGDMNLVLARRVGGPVDHVDETILEIPGLETYVVLRIGRGAVNRNEDIAHARPSGRQGRRAWRAPLCFDGF